MYTMNLLWFILINMMITQLSATQLGARCQGNSDCSVSNANCDKGVCACQPYYARVDNSTCLESTLLGSECVVSEQCTLKVAYSACLDGVCRCTDGHLQFRKHTCLSPAPPGHVCYSNEHCRLWDKESRCEFVILNLFGRCTCNSYFRQSGDKCVPTKLPTYVTDAVVADQNSVLDPSKSPSYELSNKYPKPTVTAGTVISAENVQQSVASSETYSNDVLGTDSGVQLTQENPNTPTIEASKRLPISIRKDGEPNEVLRIDEMTASLHANDQPIYRVVTQPSVENKLYKKNNTAKEQKNSGSKPQKTGHQKKSSLKDKHRNRTDQAPVIDLGPASLGMLCVTDSQCQQVDAYTRCFNKRCDCTYRSNSTSACSARNRGCMPGTFQCRSTGACISWYFVCDGRKDCPDGSDEKCQDGTGERCPINSFRCGGPGSRCVSRASRCDGTPQCPDGEDERNCKATRRRGCPRHTFRCGSGECLPEYEFCNAIISCKDASDEPPHLCNEQSRWRAADFCPLRCGNGRCRSTAVACSGRDGCGDNSDEIACTVCKCPPPPKSP